MSKPNNIAEIDAKMAMAQQLITDKCEAEAKKIYEDIITEFPNFMPAILQLGIMAMSNPYDKSEAIYYLERANQLAPDQVMIMSALGTAYKDDGFYKDAYKYLEAAVELAPSAQSHYHFAHLCAMTGAFDEAVEHYRETIKEDPHHVLAYASLAQCKTWTADDPLIDQMATCDTDISNAASLPKATLKFAYAKVLDDIGDYQNAFSQLQQAHQLKQQTQPLPDEWEAQHQQNTEDMIKFMTACKMRKAEDYRSQARNLIFVVGMPETGIDEISSLLGLHEDSYVLGSTSIFQDTIPFDQAPTDAQSLREQLNHIMTGNAVTEMAEKYISKIEEFFGKDTVYIDSLPFNFFWVGLIKIVFPQAKIIYCRRNFLDTGLSIFKRDEAAPYVWMHQLDTIGAMINSSEKLYQHWQKLFGDEIYTLQYEKFAADQKGALRDLYRFCELELDERHANTLPIKYDTDIWQNYAKDLQPLADKIHGY